MFFNLPFFNNYILQFDTHLYLNNVLFINLGIIFCTGYEPEPGHVLTHRLSAKVYTRIPERCFFSRIWGKDRDHSYDISNTYHMPSFITPLYLQ